MRRQLQATSDLGFHGASAIHEALEARGIASPPAVRTINRILRRRGVLDGQARVRRPPPPLGWYLPSVAARRHELDSFDIVEGLVIKGGPQVEVLNGVSLHGGLVASWPVEASVTAKLVVECLVEHWREFGLPGYAQFDNDTILQGTHAHPDAVGRVSRLCLSLGVVPVFVPPREPVFQAAIERYNGSWQAKVWSRFAHDDLSGLQDQSRRHVAAFAASSRGSDRVGALAAGVPEAVESGPPGSAEGPEGLPEADGCDRRGRGAGLELRGGPAVGAPAGSGGGGPGRRHGPVLPPPQARASGSADDEGGGLSDQTQEIL